MATPKKRKPATYARVILTITRKSGGPAREVISFSNVLSARLYAFGPNGVRGEATIQRGVAVSADGKTRIAVKMPGKRNLRISAARELLGLYD